VMLSLLSYAKFVSLRTPGSIAGSMWWSLNRETFFIKGRPVELARFCTMAQSVVTEAGQVLWEQVLWMQKEETNGRLSVELAAIQDDVTIVQRGVSFLSPSRLQEAEQWMLKRLASVPAARRLYEQRGGAIRGDIGSEGESEESRERKESRESDSGESRESDSGRPVQWRPQEVRRHLRLIQRFLELLSLAMHVAGGQPARGPELFSVRWRNGVLQDRNLYVIDGQVAVVTRYHKTQSQWDKPKVVVRFLPDAVGQLVTAYLLYVRPLRAMLQSALGKAMSASVTDYLWADERGPWETDQLTRIMTLESAKWLGTRLTVQEYRHAAVGIGREVVGERFATGYRTEMAGGGAEDGEGSSDEDGEDPVELQNGRTTSTGAVAYAVRADLVQGLSTRSIDVFRTLSHAWHAFLGFSLAERNPAALLKRKQETSSQAVQAQHNGADVNRYTLKRVRTVREGQTALALPTYEGEGRGRSNVGREEEEKRRIEDAVRQVLGMLPGSPVTYRSSKQEEALYAVVRGVSPLIVILPTGGGKTLLPVAAAILDDVAQQERNRPSVTILVMPFRALVEDMLVRLHKTDIKAVEWQAGVEGDYQNRRTSASIVLVSADHIGKHSGQFLSYAALLARQGVLRRVVIDECHVAITADSWRTALRKLKDVRLLPCQHVLLTATLPPSLEGQLRETMLMPGATVLRAETTQRLGVCYAVVRCQQYAELRAMAFRLARTLMDEARCLPCARLLAQEMESAAKGIIYCRSKALCDELAGMLGCPAYHSNMEASRAEVLETWRRSGGLIVSTSALGVGIDIPCVLFTLHIERPWGMIDFVQESGRMRAGGKSVIVLKQEQLQEKQAMDDSEAMDDSKAMEAFVRTAGCRRKVMSEYMDGRALSCAELQAREAAVKVAACDNCEEQQSGGRRAWQDEQSVQAVQEQVVRAKLNELAQSSCPYCWAIVHEVFEGKADKIGELGRQEQEAARHSLLQCPRVQETAMEEMEEIRREIRYSKEVDTCRKCGMMDYLCDRSSSQGRGSSKQQKCAWPNVVIPLLCGLRAAAEGRVRLASGDASAVVRTTLGRVGYQEKDSSRAGFSKWIGRQYTGGRVFRRAVGNGVAAVVAAILEEE
jgi:superfamily II DNA helicase RecQ